MMHNEPIIPDQQFKNVPNYPDSSSHKQTFARNYPFGSRELTAWCKLRDSGFTSEQAHSIIEVFLLMSNAIEKIKE